MCLTIRQMWVLYVQKWMLENSFFFLDLRVCPSDLSIINGRDAEAKTKTNGYMIHTRAINDTTQKVKLAAVRESLAELYCPADGWKIFHRFRWNTTLPDMIIQKEGRHGRERILVGLLLTPGSDLTRDEIDSLTYRLQHDMAQSSKCILVVEDDAAARIVSDTMPVLSLQDMLEHKIQAAKPKLVA